MPKQQNNIFKQVEKLINQNLDDNKIQLEMAAQVDTDETGHQTIYAGIQMNVPGLEMPIFITNGELRLLADASEDYFNKMIDKKASQETKKNKKAKVS